jgi:hypothetical protein
MRAGVLAVGTHIAFQVSSADADVMAAALGGGHHLQTRLKNLPHRHLVVKSGPYPHQEVRVPDLPKLTADGRSVYERSRARWARRRVEVEADIATRQTDHRNGTEEALDDWE